MKMFLIFLALVLNVIMPAKAETLQLGISVDMVPVESDFDGANIVIFGSVEGAELAPLYRGDYHVVIKVEGAQEDVVIRRKERIAGIWVNKKTKEYKNVPSFYTIISSKPLEEIADVSVLKEAGIGVSNIKSKPAIQGDLEFVLVAGEFTDALKRNRSNDGLFAENASGLEHLSPSLFRATVWLPPNVPIGEHKVTAYLFRDGKLLTQNTQSKFNIEKVGFERWIYNLAHHYSLVYGLMAVLIAIFTGWAANAIFRKS